MDKGSNVQLTISIYFILAFSLFTILYFAFTIEMQPWDESIYAVRTKAITEHGCVLDQTEYSLGGLYSSARPPLFFWLSSIPVTILGEIPAAHRIWTLIFALIGAYFLIHAGRSKVEGLIAACLLFTTNYFNEFSFSGQLDTAITVLILISAYFFVKHEEEDKVKYLYYSGIFTGLALLTKPFIGLIIPAAAGLYFFIGIIRKTTGLKKALNALLILTGIALLITIPWHLLMYAKHGSEFIDYYIFFELINRFAEGRAIHQQELGVFYYVNQLIVAAPFIVFAFIIPNQRKAFQFYLIAGTLIFIMISLSSSKIGKYLLMLLPFVAIISSIGLSEIIKKKRVPLILVLAFLSLAFWSFSQEFRSGMSEFLTNQTLPVYLLIYSSIFIAFVVGILILRNKISGKIVVPFVLLFMPVRMLYNYNIPPDSNIELISMHFNDMGYKSLIYYESKTPGFIPNPQVSYYFNTENFRQTGKIFICLTDSSSVHLSEYSDAMFLFDNRNNSQYADSIKNIAAENSILIFEDKYYTAYSTKPKN